MDPARFLFAFVLAPLGCRGADKAPAPAADDTAVVPNCPAPGTAMARVMGTEDVIPGDAAVGTAGDFILQNERAAYVITEPGKGSTYYHYGGIVADAVPMDGCAWAGEDKLDEVGLVLAEVELASFNESVLRGFRGDRAEVLSDGSDGGAAVVRVTGTDDYFWVVEYTLIASAISDGGRPLSEPFGIEIVVDHILEPDSPVLRTEVSVRATGDAQRELALAGLISLGPTLDLHGYAPQEISAFGLDLGFGMPWLVATDGEGALAYAVEDGSLGYVTISGVNAAVDIQQALSAPMRVAPGLTDSRTVFLSVGAAAGVSATEPLAQANPVRFRSSPSRSTSCRVGWSIRREQRWEACGLRSRPGPPVPTGASSMRPSPRRMGPSGCRCSRSMLHGSTASSPCPKGGTRARPCPWFPDRKGSRSASARLAP